MKIIIKQKQVISRKQELCGYEIAGYLYIMSKTYIAHNQLKTFKTMAQHYSMVLSDSSLLQTSL